MSTSTKPFCMGLWGVMGYVGFVVFLRCPFHGVSVFSCLPSHPPNLTNTVQTNSWLQGSRRRQKGSDYTSTSEEEYDSGNQVTPKHKRSQTPSASCSQPLIPLRPKPRSRDSDQESHEGDAYQNWSSHSAEIAKWVEIAGGQPGLGPGISGRLGHQTLFLYVFLGSQSASQHWVRNLVLHQHFFSYVSH